MYLKEERLYAAFRLFDKDSSGTISIEELKAALGSKISSEKRYDGDFNRQ